jgi:kanamycin kinase
MAELAGPPPADYVLPTAVQRLIDGEQAEPVWLNLEGGLTLRVGQDRYLKWSPTPLTGEIERLQWAARYHPVPVVLDHGVDWMLTQAIDAMSAVDADPATAARALGTGLRALHDALPVDDCPFDWSAESRGGSGAPPVDRLVVAHGDACVPNTLVDASGRWVAHVDLGRLGLADRWADLAVASMSLGWNFGAGLEPAFFEAYGVQRDELRIRFYRRLWNQPDVKIET